MKNQVKKFSAAALTFVTFISTSSFAQNYICNDSHNSTVQINDASMVTRDQFPEIEYTVNTQKVNLASLKFEKTESNYNMTFIDLDKSSAIEIEIVKNFSNFERFQMKLTDVGAPGELSQETLFNCVKQTSN
jgi:hypothetical protein